MVAIFVTNQLAQNAETSDAKISVLKKKNVFEQPVRKRSSSESNVLTPEK